MADELTAASWAAFLKKLKPEPELDDGALVKAFQKLDKVPGSKPDLQLVPLDELATAIAKQVSALAAKKKALGDKPHDTIKSKLDELHKEAKARHKETERAVAALKAAAAEDDDDSPDVLTTKMIPLLKEVRKPGVTLQALIATAGKETVVLLSRRAISASRGKLLKAQMKDSGGLKFVRADCLLEKNAVTFVVETSPAGLAKKISAALKAQTDLRVKVRVRGLDESEVDEDLEAPDPLPEPVVASSATVAADPQQTQAGDDEALRAQLNRRLDALQPRLALLSQTSASSDAGKARMLRTFIEEKSRAGSYAAALRALDALEPLLLAAEKEGAGDPPTVAEAGPALTGTAALLATWQKERAAAIAVMKDLASHIAKSAHTRSKPAILELNGVIGKLPAEPATKKQVADLLVFLENDNLVLDICELDHDIQTPLAKALKALQPALTT